MPGTLADRRQAFTLSQAKDILRGLQVVETLLTQGKTLFELLDRGSPFCWSGWAGCPRRSGHSFTRLSFW